MSEPSHRCPRCGQAAEPESEGVVFLLRRVTPEWEGDSEFVEGVGDYVHERCLARGARAGRRAAGRPTVARRAPR